MKKYPEGKVYHDAIKAKMREIVQWRNNLWVEGEEMYSPLILEAERQIWLLQDILNEAELAK